MTMTLKTPTRRRWSSAFPLVCALLASCGGGGGGGGAGGDSNGSTPPPAAQTANISVTSVGIADTVPSGSTTHLVVKVSNTGPVAATGLVVARQLATSLSQTSISCITVVSVKCPDLGTQSFKLDSLPSGGSLTFDLELNVARGISGPQNITITASASNNAVQGNVTALSTVNAYSADVGVSTTASASTVAAGGTVNYITTVVNSGPDAARNVVLNNWPNLGQIAGQVTCVASGGAVCPTTPSTFMTIPFIPVGARMEFVVPSTVLPTTHGTVVNRVRVSAAGDSNSFNDSAGVGVSAVYAPPTSFNAVLLQSDSGDYIGVGQTYVYTQATAALTVSATRNYLRVTIAGEEQWIGEFALPGNLSRLEPGTYRNLTRYFTSDPTIGGMDWTGEGRGCLDIGGTIVVNSVSYVAGDLNALDMTFEQRCDGKSAALRGQIRWNRSDKTAPQGPLAIPPAGLWAPAAATLPASGSYLYLQSDPTDFVGQGAYLLASRSYAYTKANAVFDVTVDNNVLKVTMDGNEHWSGEFQAMSSIASLVPGYYGGVMRYPFHNPAKGGMAWRGEGRGCNEESDWFIVDDIAFANGKVSMLDLRFEQHCEGDAAALRGKIHWVASDPSVPAGPIQPPPATLWAPAPGATPAAGNYVYLESEPGDFVGWGETETFTPANSTIGLQTKVAQLDITVRGQNISQNGSFQGMNLLTQLRPGYYPNLKSPPFNPTIGSLRWDGSGRGCPGSGWFVIDSIAYTNGIITAIDLRFEQRCLPNSPALRGKIHWVG